MIVLGESWCAENHRVFHACGPDLRTALGEDNRDTCDCGAAVPQRVRQYQQWLAGQIPEPMATDEP
jgi:hypothetical protein